MMHGTPVGDFHSWVRVGGPECPRCDCCTVALCEMGVSLLDGCEQAASYSSQELVRGCPCASADGSAQQAMALWRDLISHEHQKDPARADRFHSLFVERVLGPETAQDPSQAGRRLRALIAELWPDRSG